MGPEVKKVMEEKERGKEALVEREKEKEREKESQEPWLSSWTDKEKEKEKEKEEREVKELIPTAQVKCHQPRKSWRRHRILLHVRFVCSPPWAGLTLTWWLTRDRSLRTS